MYVLYQFEHLASHGYGSRVKCLTFLLLSRSISIYSKKSPDSLSSVRTMRWPHKRWVEINIWRLRFNTVETKRCLIEVDTKWKQSSVVICLRTRLSKLEEKLWNLSASQCVAKSSNRAYSRKTNSVAKMTSSSTWMFYSLHVWLKSFPIVSCCLAWVFQSS